MRILVLCAVQEEAQHLIALLSEHDTINTDADSEISTLSKQWPTRQFKLNSLRIFVVVCGIGMANAAAATSPFLIHGSFDLVCNYGCSGAHQENINAGDIVVGTHVAPINACKIRPDGKIHPQGFRRTMDSSSDPSMMPCCPKMLEIARKMEAIGLPPWPSTSDTKPAIHFGIVGSSDTWNQQRSRIQTIHDVYGTSCEEMEAAAIATVCCNFHAPFCCIKDISNNELQENTAVTKSLDHIEDELGKRAGLFLFEMLQALDKETVSLHMQV